jgi:hypothetical protein
MHTKSERSTVTQPKYMAPGQYLAIPCERNDFGKPKLTKSANAQRYAVAFNASEEVYSKCRSVMERTADISRGVGVTPAARLIS